MPVAFARFAPLMERSLSLRTFNRHETEINEHFWSFKVVSDYARYLAQAEKDIDPLKSTAALFMATGPDAGRIPPNVSQWLSAREELENWLRLSALVSAAAYLEVYLRQAIRSALMSDPLCRFGASRVLDGTVLLKSGNELPYERELEEITKGEWHSRAAAFERIFGRPLSLPQVATLDKIRRIRNEFAHGFGRDLSVPSPSDAALTRAQRLSQTTWQKYIGALSKCAAAIDKFLLTQFIGNFELIHFYHEWKSRPPHPDDKGASPAEALRRSFKRELSTSPGTQFCSDLISYYKAV
ncbi:hypothetical protein [Tardiphaga robiniae]|uniref:RiboL-PSP-HEPN domain-containing protein n=1 Tax=Tardiphaga robiniae TaxID=943830 RepID=A0A7G6U4R8_9BRAD|nr:hypothetical protein [Tardiphaga robiniae]QND74000.1 hypothetical protein HB776_24495 [Tardiphaga robiniae]